NVIKLEVQLAFFVKILLTVVGVVLYVFCFDWTLIFGWILIGLFGCLFFGLASNVVNFFVYMNTNPVILKEEESVLKNGIVDKKNIVFFRPVFAKSFSEAQLMLGNLEQDIDNNKDLGKNLKYVVLDNTEDEDLKKQIQGAIEKLQKKIGKDVVFYLHRNKECNFLEKVGIFMDAVMLLTQGWTKPQKYTGAEWVEVSCGTRDTDTPIFDAALGDLSALGIEGSSEDIAKGNEIKITNEKKMDIAFISDTNIVWPKGEVVKVIAKMKHPLNKDVAIFQPCIEIKNSDENIFVKINSWSKDMGNFNRIANWRLFKFSPFYGSGAINVSNYIEQIIKTEWIHPSKAVSSNLQEVLKVETVLMEDVVVLEQSFSNKFAAFVSLCQYNGADIRDFKEFIVKNFEAGRRSVLYQFLRNMFGNCIFAFWLFLTTLSFIFRGGIQVKSAGWFLFFMLSIVLVKFVVNIFGLAIKDKVKLTSAPTVIGVALIASIVGRLINLMDLVYDSAAFILNVISQINGKPVKCKTCAMKEVEAANITLLQSYSIFKISVITGSVLLFLGLVGVIPGYGLAFLSPFIASFIFGPFLVWFTIKPYKSL
ncbi:hypothetical protein KKC59_04030, partial [bacterium]|nr:hypothetical protein [bacterium]